MGKLLEKEIAEVVDLDRVLTVTKTSRPRIEATSSWEVHEGIGGLVVFGLFFRLQNLSAAQDL